MARQVGVENATRQAMATGAQYCKTAVVLVLAAVSVAVGCRDSPLAPTAPSFDARSIEASSVEASSVEASTVLGWNERARDLVAAHRTDPPMASRFYALLSVAQYRALTAAEGRGARGKWHGEQDLERVAVIGASANLLAALYPDEAGQLRAEMHLELSELVGSAPRGQIVAGYVLGRKVARAVLARASTDGSDAIWTGTVPTGPGMWFSSASPVQPPLRPLWGTVRPWVMSSGSQFRPEPPPEFGSPEFLAALTEVRTISDHRTAEQVRIAEFWADGAGTATPPGHWNAIAASLIEQHDLTELETARTLVLLNIAMMDAGIACWDAKFAFWLIRPSQADPSITTVLPLPNFPSYTSGHAAFSGAASEVLGELFPAERDALHAAAEEAALSRVLGGIHYRFDSESGLAQGRAIGELVTARRDELDAIIAEAIVAMD